MSPYGVTRPQWEWSLMKSENKHDSLRYEKTLGTFIQFSMIVMSHQCPPHGISNKWQFGCLFNSLFMLAKRKHQSSTLLILCEGKSTIGDWWIFSSTADIVSGAYPMPSFPSSVIVCCGLSILSFDLIFPIFGLNVHNNIAQKFWN